MIEIDYRHIAVKVPSKLKYLYFENIQKHFCLIKKKKKRKKKRNIY